MHRRFVFMMGTIGGGTVTSVRRQTFGSWLDTADVSAPGEAWMSLSSGYWRSLSLREVGRTFAPVDATSGRICVTGGLTMNVPGIVTRVPRTP